MLDCRSSAAGGVHSMVGSFKVGEKVVYPAHGVGVIEGVQTKVISGNERKFYMLRIIDSDMTIMIPTENVNSVGLRRIIGKDMVAKVYKILRDKKVEIDQQTWNRRYREYTEKIKTGSVLEIAKVLRDLFVLKGDKELSFGERKVGEAEALQLLNHRLAHAGDEQARHVGHRHLEPRGMLVVTDAELPQTLRAQEPLRRRDLRQALGRDAGPIGKARGEARTRGSVP